MKQILLATDLDDTLIGDDNALDLLNKTLSNLRNQGLLKLVYITGRSLHKYKMFEEGKSLLVPNALIASVGTEVYFNGRLFNAWPIANDWNRNYIVNALSGIKGLAEQALSEQRPHKISYTINNKPNIVDEVRQRLTNTQVDVVYSHGLYLDVLPKDVNKGSALLFLADFWKLDKNNIIACGNSANDIDMLSVAKAVIVGNALPELLNWAKYRNNHEIFVANGSYAAGVAEGLNHYLPSF